MLCKRSKGRINIKMFLKDELHSKLAMFTTKGLNITLALKNELHSKLAIFNTIG
jgi:hypothetical protein